MIRLRLVFALLLLSFAACHRAALDENAVFAGVKENLRAMQREDVHGVLATLHPDIRNRAETKTALQEMFRKYELKYTLSDLKIVSVKGDEVKVRFTQITESLGGEEPFTDNIVEGVHTLRKDGQKWKLYRTVPTKNTPLKPLAE